MHLRVSKRTSWQHLSASPNISYDAKCVIPPGLDAPKGMEKEGKGRKKGKGQTEQRTEGRERKWGLCVYGQTANRSLELPATVITCCIRSSLLNARTSSFQLSTS